MDIRDIVKFRIVDGIWCGTDDQGVEHPLPVGEGGVGVPGPIGPQGEPGPQGSPGPQGEPGTGGGMAGTFVTLDRAVQMIQRRVLPDGGHVDEALDYADAKVVAQGEYVPGGYSTLDYILAMTSEFINRIPDVDVALGGEFRWRLPWAVRPGYRGYFTFPGGVYYADHPRTMTALGGIETFLDPADSRAYCWAYLRVDMFPQMKHDTNIGEEKGVLNRRRPWGKWTPGSWIKFSVRYQTE